MKNHFGKNSLKIIVLAAGQGKRLQPLTNNKPKCMVELFGKTLLQRQTEIYRNCGISDITVVTGYYDSKINYPDIYKLKNKRYRTTNMVETLFCAENKLEGDIIISYGDIIFEKNILKNLMDDNTDISVVIDKNWKTYWEMRFTNPLNDAESLVLDDDDFIKNIGQPVKEIDQIQGQYIGLMKFQNQSVEILKQFYKKVRNISKSGLNPLNSSIPFQKSYMTDLLQGLINDGNKIKCIPIYGGWLELDSIDDYNLYNKKFNDNTLTELINLKNL